MCWWKLTSKLGFGFPISISVCCETTFTDMFILLNAQSPMFNTLRPRQNGCHLAGNIFDRILVNLIWLSLIQVSLKFVLSGPVSNRPALIHIMTSMKLTLWKSYHVIGLNHSIHRDLVIPYCGSKPLHGSGHEGATVLLPGFAINW